jgi:large subunit ribosomal protein L10
MTIAEKTKLIDTLVEQLNNSNVVYLADISGLNAEDTSNLRRLCFKENIVLRVVKNTLLTKAMDKSEKDFSGLMETLKGPSALMLSEIGNAPARLIKDFRKKKEIPAVKSAFIEEMTYIGDDQIDFLASIKSKEELIGDIIGLLQSPAKNVISALQSGGQKLSGILETLSDKEN